MKRLISLLSISILLLSFASCSVSNDSRNSFVDTADSSKKAETSLSAEATQHTTNTFIESSSTQNELHFDYRYIDYIARNGGYKTHLAITPASCTFLNYGCGYNNNDIEVYGKALPPKESLTIQWQNSNLLFQYKTQMKCYDFLGDICCVSTAPISCWIDIYECIDPSLEYFRIENQSGYSFKDTVFEIGLINGTNDILGYHIHYEKTLSPEELENIVNEWREIGEIETDASYWYAEQSPFQKNNGISFNEESEKTICNTLLSHLDLINDFQSGSAYQMCINENGDTILLNEQTALDGHHQIIGGKLFKKDEQEVSLIDDVIIEINRKEQAINAIIYQPDLSLFSESMQQLESVSEFIRQIIIGDFGNIQYDISDITISVEHNQLTINVLILYDGSVIRLQLRKTAQ